jgi:uncharacterized protein YjdB
VTALSVGETTVSAAFGGRTATVAVTVTPAALLSMRIVPDAFSLPIGLRQPLRVLGTYSDGQELDITIDVTFGSSDVNIARVSNGSGSHGLVIARSTGTATITATLGTTTATATVTVTAAVLTGIRVTPLDLVLPLGTSDFLLATGLFSDGSEREVTGQATWTSNNPAIAAVSSAEGSRGLVTALATGGASISAQLGGFTDTIEVSVTSAVLVELVVAPPTLALVGGDTGQLTVTGVYTDRTTIELTNRVSWRSSNTEVATVSNASDSAGLVTAHDPGMATITASAGPISVSATVTVTAPPP